VAETAQGLKGKKEFFFVHRILVFHFFSLFFTFFFVHGSVWCHLHCDHYDLNVRFLKFSKKFYKVHNVEVLS
jgi:hypothetical protein